MSTYTQYYYSRFGYKWNVNECLRLQREFELLRLSVPEIAALHGRTIKAIMYKIDLEGFATFNDLFIQTYGQFDGQFDSELVPQEEQELHLVPADLESESEYSDDEEDDEDTNDDDYVSSSSDEEEEEEEEEDEEEDDGSNKHYLYSQVKSMQKQITAILGYLSKGAAAAAATEDTSLFSYGNM